MKYFLIALGIAIVVCTIAVIVLGTSSDKELKASCLARGGVFVRGREVRLCLAPEALK